jgi:chromate transporter
MAVEQTPNQTPSLRDLFARFIRLGLTAFGGPSMVAYIRKLAVEQQRWLDDESFREGVALCQMIPGATAMQAAAYVGLRARGAPGAIASFVGFGLPAFGLMLVLSALYSQTQTIPVVVAAFRGLQVIVVAIIANAAVSFGRASLKTWHSVLIAVVAAALFGLSVNPIFVIAIAALLGLVFQDRQFTPRASASPMGMRHSTRPLLLLIAAAASGFVLLFFVQRTLFDLAALMFRIDLFAFGGGFASVPLMFHEIVEVRSWLDSPTFLNGIVLGQITPGPIVITATFVGYQLYGLIGGLIATVAIFLPSFLLVVGTAPYFDRLRRSHAFNQAIGGVLCSFVGLLLTVTIRFAGAISWDVPRLLLAGAAFIALLRKVDILWVVLIGAVLSIILEL